MDTDTNWQRCNLQTFWGEIASCSHVVQIYENEEDFLNLLEGFVAGGISVGNCVIIIATQAHLHALEQRLSLYGLDVAALCATDQYLPLNAEETLSKFMVNEWPDYHLFMDTVDKLFERAHQKQRKVRAFGEMVALLWSQGNSAATIMLEHLWNSYCEKESFTLFCAYNGSEFSSDATTSLTHICKAHSKMITGWGKSSTELSYFNVI